MAAAEPAHGRQNPATVLEQEHAPSPGNVLIPECKEF
jgi:hypothetical protein